MNNPNNHSIAVIFDLDGTLVDTAAEFVLIVQTLRAEHGLPPMDAQRIRASVSNGARSLVALGLKLEEGSEEFEKQRLRLLDLYSEVIGTVARPYEGISELLEELETMGIAWGIATNKPRYLTEALLQHLAIEPAPGSVVCPEDVKARKPDPESLFRNCHELNTQPQQSIFVGDHMRDIEAGRRAGMHTIAALYGYIEPDDDPQTWGANTYVERSTQLKDAVIEQISRQRSEIQDL
ncbi:MAG: HAD-IA family hydrolase [Pseudomonadota bacterium]